MMKRYIKTGIPVVFITKLLNAGLGFLATLVFARMLGINQFGQYSLASAWIAMLSTIAIFGLDGFVIKKVAVYHGQANSKLLDAISSWSLRVAIIVSLITLAVFLCGLWMAPSFANQFESTGNLIVICIVLLVPLITIARLLSSVLFGMQRIVVSQLPIMVVGPVVAILLVVLWAYLVKQLSVSVVLMAALLSNLAVLIYYLIKVDVKPMRPEDRSNSEWFTESTSFFWISVAQTITANMSIMFLGFGGDLSQVGAFSVAQKISLLVAFLLLSSNYVIAPVISKMYEEGRVVELQATVTRVSRVIFAVAVLFMLAMFALGEMLLNVFGEDFKSGYPVMMVLVLGLMVSSLASSAGTLLSMTGHSGKLAMLCGVMAIIALILNSVLIPKFGAIGAAMATSVVMVLQNGAAVYLILKYVGIDATIVGNLRGSNARQSG